MAIGSWNQFSLKLCQLLSLLSLCIKELSSYDLSFLKHVYTVFVIFALNGFQTLGILEHWGKAFEAVVLAEVPLKVR
jgi:hypothetical protein